MMTSSSEEARNDLPHILALLNNLSMESQIVNEYWVRPLYGRSSQLYKSVASVEKITRSLIHLADDDLDCPIEKIKNLSSSQLRSATQHGHPSCPGEEIMDKWPCVLCQGSTAPRIMRPLPHTPTIQLVKILCNLVQKTAHSLAALRSYLTFTPLIKDQETHSQLVQASFCAHHVKVKLLKKLHAIEDAITSIESITQNSNVLNAISSEIAEMWEHNPRTAQCLELPARDQVIGGDELLYYSNRLKRHVPAHPAYSSHKALQVSQLKAAYKKARNILECRLFDLNFPHIPDKQSVAEATLSELTARVEGHPLEICKGLNMTDSSENSM